jgi:hypothetical protein
VRCLPSDFRRPRGIADESDRYPYEGLLDRPREVPAAEAEPIEAEGVGYKVHRGIRRRPPTENVTTGLMATSPTAVLRWCIDGLLTQHVYQLWRCLVWCKVLDTLRRSIYGLSIICSRTENTATTLATGRVA